MSTRLLHVANGTCTTRLIEAAGIPGERSLWADPFRKRVDRHHGHEAYDELVLWLTGFWSGTWEWTQSRTWMRFS